MKVEFNDQGALVISSENNTEMLALRGWLETGEAPLFNSMAHQETTATVTGKPVY